MKRILSLILILALVFSLTTVVSAAGTSTTATVTGTTTLDRANALKDLGLFMGTNNGFDLDRAPTRGESIIMLLRMLGKAEEAQNSSYQNPFTDVPAWAAKYIAYAYAKGYTSGISKTTFGTNNIVTPEQFLTFMLRALGYSDKDGEFTVSTAIQKAETIKLVPVGKYKVGSKTFYRGDCVDIIYSVLVATKKPDNITIAKYLIDNKSIDATKAAKYGFYTPAPTYQMVKVALKKNTNGDWAIYGADAISAVPGAKYVLLNFAGNEVKLGDYTNVYGTDDYKVMLNPNKDANVLEYLTINWINVSQYSKYGQDTKVVVTVYDDKATMLGAGIAIARDAITNGYIELALVTVKGADVIASHNAKFEEAYGNPLEYKDGIAYLEKALVNWTFISKSTGKVVSTVAYNAPGNKVWYRYVINKTTYPDLANGAKYYSDGLISSGLSVADAVKADCLNWFKYNWDGTFNTNALISDFGTGNNEWTTKATEWNNSRYILYTDANKKPIGYTSFVPSQLKIVDVGIVEQTAYVK